MGWSRNTFYHSVFSTLLSTLDRYLCAWADLLMREDYTLGCEGVPIFLVPVSPILSSRQKQSLGVASKEPCISGSPTWSHSFISSGYYV